MFYLHTSNRTENLLRHLSELIRVQGQLVMRQPSAQVVNRVERFVKQRERQKATRPGVADDAARGTLGSVTAQTHVLNVLAPALHVPGDEAGYEVEP